MSAEYQFFGGVMDGAKITFENKEQAPRSLTVHSSIDKPNGSVVIHGKRLEVTKTEREIHHVYNLNIHDKGGDDVDICYDYDSKSQPLTGDV